MMAYQFRKLGQSFRFLSSSKSIGFSTRVNEGDQTKNTSTENTPAISSPVNICQSKTALNNFDANSKSAPSSSLGVLRCQSESDLRSHLLPPGLPGKCSPVFYRDLAQLFQVHPSQYSRLSAQDSFLRAVKRVGPTSDDILCSLVGHPGSGHPSGRCHTREMIKVDMFTKPNYQSLVASRKTADSLGLESIVINNMALNSGSATFDDHQTDQVHICCYCSSGGKSDTPKGHGNSKHGPSPSQLQDIKEDLEELVQKLFKGQHKYNILHQNIVMENNLFGENRMTVGLNNYKFELYRLRFQIKFMFFSTSMEILNVTTLEQTGTIRIHWRLKGLPYYNVYKLLSNKKSMAFEDWDWLEAFSYFHIGKDGKVHKHRIDRMMPDNEGETDKLRDKLRGLLNTAKPLVS